MMMKSLAAAAAALLSVATPTLAASTFDFESTPTGSYSALTMTDGGVTLTLTTVSPTGFVFITAPGVPLLGNRSAIGSRTNQLDVDNFTPLRFAFDQSIDSITFALGDSGGDSDDPATISAYDAFGTFLGSNSVSYPENYGAGRLLTLNFANARSFVTSSGFGRVNQDSVLWEVSSLIAGGVPEPASWALMVAGFGAVGVLRRRRRDPAAVVA